MVLCVFVVQVDFMPFDPTIKRTEGTLRGPDGKTFKCTKGAPHIILKLVEVDQEEVAKRVNWKVQGGVWGWWQVHQQQQGVGGQV